MEKETILYYRYVLEFYTISIEMRNKRSNLYIAYCTVMFNAAYCTVGIEIRNKRSNLYIAYYTVMFNAWNMCLFWNKERSITEAKYLVDRVASICNNCA